MGRREAEKRRERWQGCVCGKTGERCCCPEGGRQDNDSTHACAARHGGALSGPQVLICNMGGIVVSSHSVAEGDMTSSHHVRSLIKGPKHRKSEYMFAVLSAGQWLSSQLSHTTVTQEALKQNPMLTSHSQRFGFKTVWTCAPVSTSHQITLRCSQGSAWDWGSGEAGHSPRPEPLERGWV